jgi:DNA-binding transcriptional ArsR family regulator
LLEYGDVTPPIGSRDAKDALFDGFARIAAALASGRRLEIIDVLAQAPRTVEDVAAAIGQSVANTSHHLRRLADDGLVRAHRDGRHIVYRLASEHVYGLWLALQKVAAIHHRDLESRAAAYLGDRAEIELIDRETLRRRTERGDHVVVIDVRPEAEYVAGHIDGAIPAPPDVLGELLPLLPHDAEIVAYCRGRYCAYADQAVRQLRAAGRTAYRLDEGYREWELAVGLSAGVTREKEEAIGA